MGCGIFSIRSNGSVCEYSVTSIDDIKSKIIPFFDKYPLQGVKLLDYLDFKKAVLLKPDKRVCLGKELLEEIRQLKNGMNRGRLYSEGEKTVSSHSSQSLRKVILFENKRHYSTSWPEDRRPKAKSSSTALNTDYRLGEASQPIDKIKFKE
jgi:hypothetical protein